MMFYCSPLLWTKQSTICWPHTCIIILFVLSIPDGFSPCSLYALDQLSSSCLASHYWSCPVGYLIWYIYITQWCIVLWIVWFRLHFIMFVGVCYVHEQIPMDYLSLSFLLPWLNSVPREVWLSLNDFILSTFPVITDLCFPPNTFCHTRQRSLRPSLEAQTFLSYWHLMVVSFHQASPYMVQ